MSLFDTPHEYTPMRSINFAILPVIVIGFVTVIYALGYAPWQADYEGAREYNTASHWDRLLGNDAPEGLEENRPDGYTMRRIFDGGVYVSLMFGALVILALGFINRAWVYLPLMGVGVYGLFYTATSGLTVGPLIAAAGYALILCGAAFGWLSSPKITTE